MSLRLILCALVAVSAFACGSDPEPEPTPAAQPAAKPAAKPTWTGLGTRTSPFVATCSHNGKQLEGSVGDSVFVQCPSSCTTGGVWGSGPYTRDSSICTASVHSGVITSAGGLVVATIAPGGTDYKSTKAHGVTSHTWSSYDTSLADAAPPSKAAPKKSSTKKSSQGRPGPKRKGGKRGR